MRAKASAEPISLTATEARRIWLRAQRLDRRAPFGEGAAATPAAVAHLGYVQIDTINVIERSHHHILFTRIPGYRREHLAAAQSVDKSLFEYWTHALSYVPTADLRFFLPAMLGHRTSPSRWFDGVDPKDVARLLRQIRKDGALSIRDLDDEPVEKDHPWASRKPSKRALEQAFFDGYLTIAARDGMVKSYDLVERHFGWERRPRPASEGQVAEYLLERAMRAQGLISAGSVMYPKLTLSEGIAAGIARRERCGELRRARVDGGSEVYWVATAALDAPATGDPGLVHILSPFDPLVIQRRRLKAIFGYEHVFEAYVPKAKRQFGYFTLPVLVGDRMAALLDLKTDRAAGRVLIQAWHWLPEGRKREDRPLIEAEIGRFEAFQLGRAL